MSKFEERIAKAFPNPPDSLDIYSLREEKIPNHVAIIMDGNGRWAKERGLSRLDGHKAGIESVRECIYASNDLGIEYLTIYAFSTENWKRPKVEVNGLMKLFAETLQKELGGLMDEQVRMVYLGDNSRLPQPTRSMFEKGLDSTQDNKRLTLCFAVDYGSRAEIVNAVRQIAKDVESGKLSPSKINEKLISSHLYTAGVPDPDLVIRTSGEYRLSNFLMWQAAYSEIYITDTLWPDFNRYEFGRALLEYQSRDRRFGGIKQ